MTRFRMLRCAGALLIGVAGLTGCGESARPAPGEADFVSVTDVDPTIRVDARYFGVHNFIGSPIAGYEAPKCLLTRRAAAALAEVQRELAPMRLSLKTYDCYRPQRAVDQFVAWANDLGDVKMKKEFYPSVDKANLFRDGYIAAKSGHSRGSTVDVTIVALPAPASEQYHPGDSLRECFLPAGQRFGDDSLDFGTGFDCFDPAAHTANPTVGGTQRGLRALLSDAMADHGFENLPEEWWHFTLRDEPFPDIYFDFPVR
ncbi:M15 family metallopeptidase [Nocardia sp. CDC159]|uniref:D-alanyl-D-alanine dipeptidase n=1 Tax=Nocardia pulmonis TaxID=2951408 RepID=A0A9X2E3S2_9NOCA|nr:MULTISPECIES: M15 family metallopeptidase [Nocardia]MCM6773121.1 M15 family metallopeptidase [Nocardia pulmonis]MCM6785576.1 M15 family metallopeptidase [Nocardia sp. CDC159]